MNNFMVTKEEDTHPYLEIQNTSPALHLFLSKMIRNIDFKNEAFLISCRAKAFFLEGAENVDIGGDVLIVFFEPNISYAQAFVDYVNENYKGD